MTNTGQERNNANNDAMAQDSIAGVKSQRTGFDSRPFQVIFVVVKVTGNVFIELLGYSLGSIIPPVLHDHSIMYHRRYKLATDSVNTRKKKKTKEHNNTWLSSVTCRVIQFAEQTLCVTQGYVQGPINGCKWGEEGQMPV